MKPVTLDIRRLGPIADSKVVLKPFMLLSGESGLGKSYVSMLIHYIYRLVFEARTSDFFEQQNFSFDSWVTDTEDAKELAISTRKLSEWINTDAVRYMKRVTGNSQLNMDVHIEMPFDVEEIALSYRKELVGIPGKETLYTVLSLADLQYRVPPALKGFGDFALRALMSAWMRMSLFESDKLIQTCLLIPGRGSLLSAPRTVQEGIGKSFGMVAEFLDDWNILCDMVPQEGVDDSLCAKIRELNGGGIAIKEDRNIDYVTSEAGALPIAAAASSVKELTPLAVLLEKFPVHSLSILFEEPEAHLHPTKQVKIADLIVEMVSKGAHLQVTTHSDYFLRRINDRITLFRLKEADNSRYGEACKEYGYSDITLDPGLVGAYLLRRRDDQTVELEEQAIGDEGVPYASFYDVVDREVAHSMDIIKTLEEVRDAQSAVR